MSEWQPIETAPKDGTVFQSYWDGVPVYVAWLPIKIEYRDFKVGRWPFQRTVREEVSGENGFRVMSWSPRLGWGINGNCAPFEPTHWMPLPEPPA